MQVRKEYFPSFFKVTLDSVRGFSRVKCSIKTKKTVLRFLSICLSFIFSFQIKTLINVTVIFFLLKFSKIEMLMYIKEV